MAFYEIKHAIEMQHQAFDVFTKRQDERLDELRADLDGLRDGQEKVEAKGGQPGPRRIGGQ